MAKIKRNARSSAAPSFARMTAAQNPNAGAQRRQVLRSHYAAKYRVR